MRRSLWFSFFMLSAAFAFTQVIGHVDKRTKEYFIPSDLKVEYRVFGYEVPNITSRKMICFSSRMADVKANSNSCPLGSYYDTGKLKIGDRISYLGAAGSFAKMIFISGSGKKTIFYLPKSSIIIK
jgi:hypothetical protein